MQERYPQCILQLAELYAHNNYRAAAGVAIGILGMLIQEPELSCYGVMFGSESLVQASELERKCEKPGDNR